MDNYILGGIFEPNGQGGYGVYFPDLPGCISCGNTLDEALTMSKEALELHIFGMEEDNDTIPNMTAIESLKIPTGCFVVPIKANMKIARNKMNNKAIKKVHETLI